MFRRYHGSYDGAKICELLGIFILKSLGDKIEKQGIELDRDDGLMILRNVNGQKTDRTRKYIIRVIKELGFQIEIKTNLKEVNCLDVTLNSKSGLDKPHKKPNDQLLDVTISSDYPPQVIKQLLKSTNGKQVYLGVAECDRKQIFYNHIKLIKNKSYRNDTKLSRYVWVLRDKHSVFLTLT